MSKIICEVCGTSFPETAAQCPICGSVHSGDVTGLPVSAENSNASGEYAYVKGGRFSKSNVRKRNMGVQVPTTPAPKKKSPEPEETAIEDEPEQKSASNKGLIITIIVLILAIVAVLGYIVVKFLLPSMQENTEPPVNNEVVEDTNVPCTDIMLDTAEVRFTEVGQTAQLHINVLPAETTDSVSFVSDNEAVAIVDNNGVVTAVSRGETIILATCGSMKAECVVVCDIIPPEALEFRLNRQQITFDVVGSGWLLYSGDIAVEDIVWTSDDESVVTIEEGRITAVGEGYTRVHGEYLGNKQSCEVICAFEKDENEGHEGNGGVSEDGSQDGDSSDNQGENTESSGEYHLDNLFSSYDTEVTIRVGEWFPLRLVDDNGNSVDATWHVQNGNVCKVNGGDVTALASGETYIIATYNGQEYRCRVIVL